MSIPPEGDAEGADPGVELPVVPKQAACLEGLAVVEAELAGEVVVGRELDGRDLGGELVRHRVELLAAGQHLQRLQQRQVRLVVSRDLGEEVEYKYLSLWQ